MGRPKLLLPWGKTSILGQLLERWREAGARQIAVVCAVGDSGIRTELARLRVPGADIIENPAPELGMFSSVRCGVRWNGWASGISHWVIVLGDQPHLRQETLTGLLGFAAQNSGQICQPAYHGRPAHPVILPQALFQAVATTKACTLKEFLATARVCRFVSDDAGLELDIDRPEDYMRALALAGLAS